MSACNFVGWNTNLRAFHLVGGEIAWNNNKLTKWSRDTYGWCLVQDGEGAGLYSQTPERNLSYSVVAEEVMQAFLKGTTTAPSAEVPKKIPEKIAAKAAIPGKDKKTGEGRDWRATPGHVLGGGQPPIIPDAAAKPSAKGAKEKKKTEETEETDEGECVRTVGMGELNEKLQTEPSKPVFFLDESQTPILGQVVIKNKTKTMFATHYHSSFVEASGRGEWLILRWHDQTQMWTCRVPFKDGFYYLFGNGGVLRTVSPFHS